MFRDGMEPMAVGYYQWITEVQPTNARAWKMLGRCCLVSLGGEANALQALRKAVELDPADAEARSALASLERQLAVNPNLLDQGKRQWDELLEGFLRDIRPNESIGSSASVTTEEAQSTVESWPIDKKLWAADAMFNGRAYAEALKEYGAILQLDPNNFAAQMQRSLCIYKLGDAQEAMVLLDRLTRDHAEISELWHNLGTVQASLGQSSAALKSFERALDNGGNRVETWTEMAGVYYQMSPRENHDRALGWLAKAITISPDFAAAHELRARILDDLDRNIEALVHYDRSLELAPGTPGAMFGRALVLFKLARFSEAAAQFKAVVEQYPNNANAWANLATAVFASGCEEEGLSLLIDAIRHTQDSDLLQVVWCDLRCRQLYGQPLGEKHSEAVHRRLLDDLRNRLAT